MKLKTCAVTFLAALLLLAVAAPLVHGNLYISEFLASNSFTIRDEDDDYSDWIEIYNASDRTIDLKGWRLTDDHDDANKWRFPSHRIEPGEFLIVFASGKDRNEIGRELHTNFKLSRSGEYLALVNPHGETVHEYGLSYPEQHSDVSHGLLFTVPDELIVGKESTYSWLIPTNGAADTTWMNPDFDDSEWSRSTGGIGYGIKSWAYRDMIKTLLPVETRGAYVRYRFKVDRSEYKSMGLHVQYDDGFVAYLNGRRVASANVPDETPWNAISLGSHNERRVDDFTVHDISEHLDLLHAGENVLALHVLNRSTSSSDLLLVAELEVSGGDLVLPLEAGALCRTSPGRHNASRHPGFAQAVAFGRAHGFYDRPFELELKTGTPGAEIRYTLDGSIPTQDSGLLYTNVLPIDHTTILRAVAFHPDMKPSETSTRTYLFVEDVIHDSPDGVPPGDAWPTNQVNEQVMDYGLDPDILNNPRYAPLMTNALLSIPSYSLVTAPNNLFSKHRGIYVNTHYYGEGWEKESSAELLHPDGSEGFQIECGIRIRGGHSRWGHNPKHAFRLLFRGTYGHGHLSYPLFGSEGVADFENIDLRTSQNYSWAFENGEQFTMCREVFSRDTQRDMGQPYTRSRACHLYLNGHYWGLFQTQERSEASFAASYFGGMASDYDVVKIRGGIGQKFRAMATDGDMEAWEKLWKATRVGFKTDEAYYKVLGRNPDGSRNPEYEILVDPENLIDYMLCTYYVGDPDGPVNPEYELPNNFYAIRRRDGTQGFQFFRHDAEHSMDELNEDRTVTTELGLQTFAHFNPKILHERLLRHPDYRQLASDRVYKFFFHGGALTPEACRERFLARVKEIELAVIAESARWGDAQNEQARTRDDDWRPAIDWLLNEYIPQRSAIVLEQLKKAGCCSHVEPVTLNQRGGVVESGFQLVMTAPEGTIYYTTDGQDPRLLGGKKYRRCFVRRARGGKPLKVPILRTTKIMARVFHRGEWSTLTEVVFSIGAARESIRLTELMYNPPPDEGRSRYDNDDFEFVELRNMGDKAVDLAGCQFVEGIEFQFGSLMLEPGAFAVICRNREAFLSRYDGRGITIAGEYSGRLHNAEDQLKLVDLQGNTLLSLSYDDSLPSTDGGGHSLILTTPQTKDAGGAVGSWQASHQLLGTPGRTDGMK